jgi:hypothetical protein
MHALKTSLTLLLAALALAACQVENGGNALGVMPAALGACTDTAAEEED